MTYVAAALAVTVFVGVFERLGIVDVARHAIGTSRSAGGTLIDPHLSDEEKEQALRVASLSLVRDFLRIGLFGALALAASAIPVGILHLAGLAEMEATIAWLGTWQAIGLISIVILAWYAIPRAR